MIIYKVKLLIGDKKIRHFSKKERATEFVKEHEDAYKKLFPKNDIRRVADVEEIEVEE